MGKQGLAWTYLGMHARKLDAPALGRQCHHVLQRDGAVAGDPGLQVVQPAEGKQVSKKPLGRTPASHAGPRARLPCAHVEKFEVSTSRRWPVWAINTCVAIARHSSWGSRAQAFGVVSVRGGVGYRESLDRYASRQKKKPRQKKRQDMQGTKTTPRRWQKR